MGHGAGGGLTQEIIELARAAFASPHLDGLDSAVLPPASGRIAFTTDSYVIRPIFFPGGDIGRIAVCGTVNDLSVVGAVPRYLSCGLILEEGLPLESLERVLASMAQAAREAEVQIVTGDTKVVEKGHGDGIYINTAGIGFIPEGLDLSGRDIMEGDLILVSGFLGDHAMTIMNLRESLGFDSALLSDCAPLGGLAATLIACGGIKFMRDLTRGGLAAALHELADLRGLAVELEEESLPVRDGVRVLSEILGIDPLGHGQRGQADGGGAGGRRRAGASGDSRPSPGPGRGHCGPGDHPHGGAQRQPGLTSDCHWRQAARAEARRRKIATDMLVRAHILYETSQGMVNLRTKT